MFLNREYGLDMVCIKPSKDDVLKANRGEIEKQLMALYNQPKPLSDKDKLIWLQLCMAYFHKVNVKLSALRATELIPCENGMLKMVVENKEYWIPRF